jgi:hypothetical protein
MVCPSIWQPAAAVDENLPSHELLVSSDYCPGNCWFPLKTDGFPGVSLGRYTAAWVPPPVGTRRLKPRRIRFPCVIWWSNSKCSSETSCINCGLRLGKELPDCFDCRLQRKKELLDFGSQLRGDLIRFRIAAPEGAAYLGADADTRLDPHKRTTKVATARGGSCSAHGRRRRISGVQPLSLSNPRWAAACSGSPLYLWPAVEDCWHR